MIAVAAQVFKAHFGVGDAGAYQPLDLARVHRHRSPSPAMNAGSQRSWAARNSRSDMTSAPAQVNAAPPLRPISTAGTPASRAAASTGAALAAATT